MSFEDYEDMEDYFDEMDGYVNYMRHEYCFDEFEGYGDEYAGAKGILSSFLPDGTSVTHGTNANRRADSASEGNLFDLCFWHVISQLGIFKFDEISKLEISNIK